MIQLDLAKAVQSPGEEFEFAYQGHTDFDEELSLKDGVVLEAKYSVLDERVTVRGCVSCSVVMPCARCLSEVMVDLAIPFLEVIVKTAEFDDAYTYEGETLVFDKLVYDALVMHMPGRVLCDEKCRGICPSCGQDLNQTQCACNQQQQDDGNPFLKLKDLF